MTEHQSHPATTDPDRARPVADSLRGDRRMIISGFLFGCGITGSVIDLFVFHLGLQWHHFYDLFTTRIALLSDGIFHALTWLITVWGLFMLAGVRQHIRYGVDLFIYDLVWIGSAVVLIIIGLIGLWATRHHRLNRKLAHGA